MSILAIPSSIDDDSIIFIFDDLLTLNIRTVGIISYACEFSEYTVNSLWSLVNELMVTCKSLLVIIIYDIAALLSRLHHHKEMLITLGSERIAHLFESVAKRLCNDEVDKMDLIIDNFANEISRLETAIND